MLDLKYLKILLLFKSIFIKSFKYKQKYNYIIKNINYYSKSLENTIRILSSLYIISRDNILLDKKTLFNQVITH